MIYFRQTLQTVPIKYDEHARNGGLIVSQKHALAISTHGTGTIGATGPTGATGAAGEPYLWDTIIASASNEYSDLTANLVEPATHFRAPFPITVEYIRASLSIAPEGAPVIIHIYMNGLSMLSSPIQIDIGTRTSVGSIAPSVLSVIDVPDDAEFTIFIAQTGTSVPGAGAKVAVTGKKVQAI